MGSIYSKVSKREPNISISHKEDANFSISREDQTNGVSHMTQSATGSRSGFGDFLERDKLYKLRDKMIRDHQGNAILTVKLLLQNLKPEEAKTSASWLQSNVGKLLGANHYGADIHSAIQCSDWILHWYDDSTVHKHNQLNRLALVSVDVCKLDLEQDETVEKLERLRELIELWNGPSKKYNVLTCNCHHFVEAVLKVLGEPQGLDKFDGQLGAYLKTIRDKGSAPRQFVCPKTYTVHAFKTHAELDKFIIAKLAKYECTVDELVSKYCSSGDLALLKSFDRAFYLAHTYYTNAPDATLEKQGVTRGEMLAKVKPDECCPFGCPFGTHSFLQPPK